MNVADEPLMPQRKEAKMKGYNGPLILCAALLFGALLIAPAFAEMKKADESELSRTNASVTGASVKGQIVDVEKYVLDQEKETLQDSKTFNKDANAPPSVSKGSNSVDTYVSGHTASNVGFAGLNMITTGGITAAKPR